jgi:hypothetical protein
MINLVCQRADIYVLKIARAMFTNGHKVTLFYHELANPDLQYEVEASCPDLYQWETFGELVTDIPGKPEADFWVVFGQPAKLAIEIKKEFPLLDIVYCARNMMKQDLEDEAEAVMACGKWFTPSKGFAEELSHHCTGLIDECPHIVIHPKLPREWMKRIDLSPKRITRRNGVVYEGGFDDVTPWRNYLNAVKACSDMGIPFTLYSCDNFSGDRYLIAQKYMGWRAAVHGPIDYFSMLNQIKHYEFGWCAGDTTTAYTTGGCVTNKLFECMAAGLPVVVDDESEQHEVVIEMNWPHVTAENMLEVCGLSKVPQCDDTRFRDVHCMENEITKLWGLVR